MTAGEIADREAIRQLLAAYNVAGDRGRVDLLAATFADDGALAFSGEESHGRAAIAARLGKGAAQREAGERAGPAVVRHHLTTSAVEIDGDKAQARTYFIVHTEIGPDHHGVYVDRLVRTAEGWRFVHREVRIDWQSPQTLFPPLHVRGRTP